MTWPTKTDFVDGDVLTATQVNNIGTNLNLYDPTSATSGQVPIADGAGSVAFGLPPSAYVQITPSSINFTGTSATIESSGTVSFSACTIVSLNGIFSATYKNYYVLLSGTCTAATYIPLRYRAAGSDLTASSYKTAYSYNSGGTPVDSGNSAQTFMNFFAFMGINGGINSMLFLDPYAGNRKNAGCWAAADNSNNPFIFEAANYYQASTTIDGLSIRQDLNTGNVTGTITVWGIKEA